MWRSVDGTILSDAIVLTGQIERGSKHICTRVDGALINNMWDFLKKKKKALVCGFFLYYGAHLSNCRADKYIYKATNHR